MSASTHHIQSVRYNRGLQIVPKSRVFSTFKTLADYFKGRDSYGELVIDSLSSVERRSIRRRLKIERRKDTFKVAMAVTIFIVLVTLFIYFTTF